jgi:hypothetical protein
VTIPNRSIVLKVQNFKIIHLKGTNEMMKAAELSTENYFFKFYYILFLEKLQVYDEIWKKV